MHRIFFGYARISLNKKVERRAFSTRGPHTHSPVQKTPITCVKNSFVTAVGASCADIPSEILYGTKISVRNKYETEVLGASVSQSQSRSVHQSGLMTEISGAIPSIREIKLPLQIFVVAHFVLFDVGCHVIIVQSLATGTIWL